MTDTFTLGSVEEVRLPKAPLAKVLAQIQFSKTPDLVSEVGEQRLAALLRRYPVRRQGLGAQLQMAVGGVPGLSQFETPGILVRLFSTTDNTWQVAVGETSVTLETTAYESRDDFCTRAGEVFAALADISLPPVVDRIGLRYVDRFVGDELGLIPEYVIPPMRALFGLIDPPLILEHSVTESSIKMAEDTRLKIRSGFLPPSGTFDPVIPMIAEPSWVLDLDIFTIEGGYVFDAPALEELLRKYGDHVHSFFRFTMTERFMADHGEEGSS